jgi:hypothetical protein
LLCRRGCLALGVRCSPLDARIGLAEQRPSAELARHTTAIYESMSTLISASDESTLIYRGA